MLFQNIGFGALCLSSIVTQVLLLYCSEIYSSLKVIRLSTYFSLNTSSFITTYCHVVVLKEFTFKYTYFSYLMLLCYIKKFIILDCFFVIRIKAIYFTI